MWIAKIKDILNSHKKTSMIHSLAPTSDLYDLPTDERNEYLEYHKALKAAFRDKSIHNIAITGNHGVGKSSLIRSYEKKDPHKKKGYLYISLISFEDKAADADKGKNDNVDLFEHYLLSQILSRTNSKTTPLSTFKLIPEKHKIQKWLFIVVTVILILCIFSTANTTNLGIPDGYCKFLYFTEGIAGAFIAFLGMLYVNREMRFSKLSAKRFDIEVKAENQIENLSYIDRHIFEIVYALESMAKQIGYTVVFEDMDRLDKKVCVEIFTKMRRINGMINDRKRLGNHHIRFVYLFDDSVFELTKNTKFFDYIVSVIPRLNYRTSANYIRDVLKNSLVSRQDSQVLDMINGFPPKFWDKVGEVVYDYRTINHIINEFTLFSALQIIRGNQINKKWLLFIIYKNILPDDYCQSFSEKNIFELFGAERDLKIKEYYKNRPPVYAESVCRLIDDFTNEYQFTAEDFFNLTGTPPSRDLDVQSREDYLEIERLLSYVPERHNPEMLLYFGGKTILITNVFASGGEDLCRGLLDCGIKQLIMMGTDNECGESLKEKFSEEYEGIDIQYQNGSVMNPEFLSNIIFTYIPEIVFHNDLVLFSSGTKAQDTRSILKKNIRGTGLLLNAISERVTTDPVQIILITDSKVNIWKESITAASVKFAEWMVLGCAEENTSSIRTYPKNRGLEGLYKAYYAEAKNDGIVRITDKRIIRYFMPYKEIIDLILNSAVLANGHQTFSFDMGKPFKLLTIAECAIIKAGLIPDEDIPIEETGLRPGEKLYEEVLMNDPFIETLNPLIFEEKNKIPSHKELLENYKDIINALDNEEIPTLKEMLISILKSVESDESLSSTNESENSQTAKMMETNTGK